MEPESSTDNLSDENTGEEYDRPECELIGEGGEESSNNAIIGVNSIKDSESEKDESSGSDFASSDLETQSSEKDGESSEEDSIHEEDGEKEVIDEGGLVNILQSIPEVYKIDVNNVEKRVLIESNEDELMKSWSASFNPFLFCWKYPQIIKNLIFLFMSEWRVRSSFLIVYAVFTVDEPILGIPLFLISVFYVIIETSISTVIIAIYHASDLHSTFRIVLRYELWRHWRCYKWMIWLSLSLSSAFFFISFIVFTNTGGKDDVTGSFLFSYCYGRKSDEIGCACVAEESTASNSTLLKEFRGVSDGFSVVTEHVSYVIFIAVFNGLLRFFGQIMNIMNYEGPASQRMNSELGWPCNRTKLPDLKIGLCDILWVESEVILRSIHQMIFFVESDEDVKRLSKLPSFSHLRWKYLKGLSTSDIVWMRNFFYNFKEEEQGRYDQCCYRNEKCCCLQFLCKLYCCFCCFCACLYTDWVMKLCWCFASFREGKDGRKLREYKRDEVKATILKNLDLIRGKQKTRLVRNMRQSKCKELQRIVFVRKKSLEIRLLILFRRVKLIQRYFTSQEVIGWDKDLASDDEKGEEKKSVINKILSLEGPEGVMGSRAEGHLRVGRGIRIAKHLRDEKKWFDETIEMYKDDGRHQEFCDELETLLRVKKFLIDGFRKIRWMITELDERIEELELREFLAQYESGEFSAETRKKVNRIKRAHERLDTLLENKKRRTERRLDLPQFELENVKEFNDPIFSQEYKKRRKRRKTSKFETGFLAGSGVSQETFVSDIGVTPRNGSIEAEFAEKYDTPRGGEDDDFFIEDDEAGKDGFEGEEVVDISEILADLQLVDRKPTSLLLTSHWMKKAESTEAQGEILLLLDENENEGGESVEEESTSSSDRGSDSGGDGEESESVEYESDDSEEKSFIELTPSKSMTIKKKRDMDLLGDGLTFDRLSFVLKESRSRRTSEQMKDVKKKETENDDNEDKSSSESDEENSSEKEELDDDSDEEEVVDDVFVDMDGQKKQLLKKKTFMKVGLGDLEDMFSSTSESSSSNDEESDEGFSKNGFKVIITEFMKNKSKLDLQGSDEEEELEISSGEDEDEKKSYRNSRVFDVDTPRDSYLAEQDDSDEYEDHQDMDELFEKDYAGEYSALEMEKMKVKPTHHSRGFFSYFIEKRNKSEWKKLLDWWLYRWGCSGYPIAIWRMFLGILYIFFLQISLRKSFILIISALLFKSPFQFILLGIFLALELFFSSMVLVCCYFKDLQSFLKIILHWEFCRESRLTKFYLGTLLFIVFFVGLSGYFDFGHITSPSFYGDYDRDGADFWLGLFSRNNFDPPFMLIADQQCECNMNMTATETFEELNPNERRWFFELYLWLFALIPSIKYIVVAFFSCIGMSFKLANFDGPGCVLYENQLKEKRQTSFFIPKFKRRFPFIRLSAAKLWNSTPSEILEKLINVLYYVSSEKDAENFSKIRSLQHLEWGMLKNIDDQVILDLRSFFLRRYTIRDEIPRSETCIECRNWFHKNETCCALRFCWYSLCFCEPFGRDVSFVKNELYRELEDEVEENKSKNLGNRDKLKTICSIVDRGDNRIKRLNDACEELEGSNERNMELRRLRDARKGRLAEEQKMLRKTKEYLDKKKLRRTDRVKKLASEIRAMQEGVKDLDVISMAKKKIELEMQQLELHEKEIDQKALKEKIQLSEVNKILLEGKKKHEKNSEELMDMYKQMYHSKEQLEQEMINEMKELETLNRKQKMFRKQSRKKLRMLVVNAKSLKEEVSGMSDGLKISKKQKTVELEEEIPKLEERVKELLVKNEELKKGRQMEEDEEEEAVNDNEVEGNSDSPSTDDSLSSDSEDSVE